MSYPTTHRSATVVEDGKIAVKEKKVPAFKDEEVLVRVRYNSINPMDWKLPAWGIQKEGSSTGGDYAGDVVAVGSKAEEAGYKVGDVVAGFVPCTNENGAFQEYVAAPVQAVIHAAGLPYADASTLGVCLSTASLALHWTLKTPFEGIPKAEPFLVWAGSTGVGMYAIKLAAHAGYRVVTTCSPQNFDLVKSLGASAAFDYKDPETPAKIRAWVEEQNIGPLRKGLDNISENGATELALSSFSDGKGDLAILLDYKGAPTTVELHRIRGWDIYAFGTDPQKSVRKFYDSVPKLIQEGVLREGLIPLLDWQKPGLEGVIEAIDYVHQGKHSGQKVVVKIA